MSRRTLTNLLLLAVVAALGLVLWLDREREAEAPPLLALDSADVDLAGFHLHARDVRVAMQREGDGWVLTEPVSAPADPQEINSLLSVIRSRTHDAVDVAAVGDLAQFGLDEPERTLFYNDIEVYFGNVNPVTLRRYVRIGDRILQINDPAGAPQNLDHSNFVDKRVLPEGMRLARIELPHWTLRRNELGGWEAEARDGQRRRISSDTAQHAADEWHRARAMWTQLRRDDEAPREPVTLYPEDGEPFTLHAVRGQQFILQREEYRAQYHLARSLAELMLDLQGDDEDEEDGPADIGTAENP